MVSTVRKKEMGGCQLPFSLSFLTEIKLPQTGSRVVLAALSLSLSFSPSLSRSAPRFCPECLSIHIIPQFLATMLQLLLLSTLP
ncbi:hypothetical protein V6N13_091128 [Hibiscus sabdariffa]